MIQKYLHIETLILMVGKYAYLHIGISPEDRPWNRLVTQSPIALMQVDSSKIGEYRQLQLIQTTIPIALAIFYQIYIDDILLFSHDHQTHQQLLSNLPQEFPCQSHEDLWHGLKRWPLPSRTTHYGRLALSLSMTSITNGELVKTFKASFDKPILGGSTLIDKGKGLADEHSNKESNDYSSSEEVPNEDNSSNKEVLDEERFIVHRNSKKLSTKFERIRHQQQNKRVKNNWNHRLSRKGYAGFLDEICSETGLVETKVDMSVAWNDALEEKDKRGEFKADARNDILARSIGRLATSGWEIYIA
ncbi:hypothetical protein CUMW_230590 [Citrus unshiu]|uniref:Uncharacterized protein n=1 Tax=Citrus unshiu TaxID=55188 RepID=A0A2H5QHJ1_CITUN|nr:hypothetical protein CUMW_230590 [Citrus unshiu]